MPQCIGGSACCWYCHLHSVTWDCLLQFVPMPIGQSPPSSSSLITELDTWHEGCVLCCWLQQKCKGDYNQADCWCQTVQVSAPLLFRWDSNPPVEKLSTILCRSPCTEAHWQHRWHEALIFEIKGMSTHKCIFLTFYLLYRNFSITFHIDILAESLA